MTQDVGRGASVAGITKLCRASVHLPHLDVSGNELRAVDVAQLATAAIDRTHLIDINITGNRASTKTVELLQDRVNLPYTMLTHIRWDGDTIAGAPVRQGDVGTSTAAAPAWQARRGCRIGMPLRRGLQQQLRWSDDEHDGETTIPLPPVEPRTSRRHELPTKAAEPWTEVRSTTRPVGDREWRDAQA